MVKRKDMVIKERMFLHGLENLIGLGGFIKEEVEDEILELYPNIVAEKTEKYCPLGKGFWDVADAVEAVAKEDNKYDEYLFDDDRNPFEPPKRLFEEWAIEQVARITSENYRNREIHFWNSWNLSRDTKNALKKLNALDERILLLHCGINDGHKMSAKEIAELEEFSCNENYINKVLEAVERTLNDCEWGNKEFAQVCELQRSRRK